MYDAPDRPRRPAPTQADVDKLFSPSVRTLPQEPTRNRMTLVSNVASLPKPPKQYILDRIAAIDGRTFEQARHLRFKTAKGALEFYKEKDMKYDLRCGYLKYAGDAPPLQSSDIMYHRANLAASWETFHANALIQTGDEPLTRREAKQRDDWDDWYDSEQVEWNRLWADGCFEWVPADSVGTARVISTRFVYKKKPHLHKSRLVARGFLQDLSECGDTWSPVTRPETVRVLLC